jgi:isoleucyl-tRNA synthetase
LPGNVALAVGEKIKYIEIKPKTQSPNSKLDENYILAKDRLKEIMVDKDYEIIKEFLGRDLVGLEYEPLFDNYIKSAKVYIADFVTTEDGTGIVHIAPAFGADDMELGKKENLPFVQHVKMDGTFKEEMGNLAGLDLKPRVDDKLESVRKADIEMLKALGDKVFDKNSPLHSYPHCWRCDTALLNYATSSWFVAVEKIKSKLLKTAKKIYWSPGHIKEGRFGQWLQGARDWSISRQRFWANTIPVWRCEKCKKETVFGSAKELKEASGIEVNDLHKDIVDEVVFDCKCGGKYSRVPDVLDTWFDSGSVPFATKRPIPADFIGEAQDQTRAWFYYQHVLIGALFGKQAFKNCIVTGIILAEDGKKMSKKLKNYPDPVDLINRYGADAIRFYMLNSPVVQADNLFFSEKGVDEILKKNISRLYNILAFYQLYKDGTPAKDTSKNILDQWIISRLNQLVKTTTNGYENYKIDAAIRPITDFIDDFSVWYLRRSRERFKEEGSDKKDAISTLRFVLEKTALVLAPIMPFSSENIYQEVKGNNYPESVHLCDWPKISKSRINNSLEEKMVEARAVVNLALAERIVKGIKVKQVLASLTIKNLKSKIKDNKDFLQTVMDEINVKEIIFNGKINNEVELDINITESLKEEGFLRDLIRQVQAERKEQKLIPQDRILVEISLSEKERVVIEKNKDLLLKEFRANEISFKVHESDQAVTISLVKQ